MINFKKLVEHAMLVEASTKFAQDLGAFFHSKYDSAYIFPDPGSNPAFEREVETNIFTRGTQNAYLTPVVRDHYHYIDYLCFVNELQKKTSGQTRNINIKDIANLPNIDQYTADYIKAANSSFKGSPGTMYPVINYYQPVSYTVKGVHDKVLSALVTNNMLGRLAIENYIANNYTLSEAINDVVVLRQQTISRARPKQTSKDVDDLIINYKQYLPGGGKMMPSKFDKASELYISLAESIEKYTTTKGSPVENTLRQTVKTINSDTPLSKDVIKNLGNLANFIPERASLSKELSDFAQGAQQFFKGLSMGVPTVGGKR
jgi:hypothetical protein